MLNQGIDMDVSYNILIVDDVSDNIKIAESILKDSGYNFLFAGGASQALYTAKERSIDLVLVDVMMPELHGFDVIEALNNDTYTKNIPIIFVAEKTTDDDYYISKGFELGAIDCITIPFNKTELSYRVSTHLSLYKAEKILKQNCLDLNVKIENDDKLLSELESTQQEIINILTELMESTCDETGKHIKRVAELSKLLASLHDGISDDEVQTIFHAAPLHDIGKITIDRDILNKPSKLSEREFRYMKEHTTNAHYFLKKSQKKLIKAGDIIAYQHHEWWNGTGYPRGLKGEEIHIYGRIVAIGDVLDTLTHKRVYKESWGFEEAAKYIIEHRGVQFDPYLVELFENNLDKFREIIEN